MADSYFFKWSLLYCYMFCHPLPPANKNLPAVNLGSNKAGGKKKSLFAVSKKKKEVMAHIIDDDDVEDQNLEGFWGKQGGHAGTLN